MNNLEKIFSHNPASPIFTILASLYYNQRSYKHAARVCQAGLKHDPDNIPGQYILAKLLLLKDETVLAEKILKKIILSEPQHLNALLLLIIVMKKLNRSFHPILPYIKQSAQLYTSNPMLQNYYKKYCIKPSIGEKQSKNIIKKAKKQSDFLLNPKLATKTLYSLFYSQKKYSSAYHVLTVMKKNKKNKAFITREMKKIKSNLSKG